jgi:hypothetical protein
MMTKRLLVGASFLAIAMFVTILLHEFLPGNEVDTATHEYPPASDPRVSNSAEPERKLLQVVEADVPSPRLSPSVTDARVGMSERFLEQSDGSSLQPVMATRAEEVTSTVSPASKPPYVFLTGIPKEQRSGALTGVISWNGSEVPRQTIHRGSQFGCPDSSIEESLHGISGRVVSNAVVRVLLNTAGSREQLPEPRVTLQECMFQPRVSIVEASCGAIQVENKDQTLHKLKGLSEGRIVFERALYPGNSERIFLGGFPSVLELRCDHHAWETAYVVNNPSPFAAVSNAQGQFKITGIPDGVYVIETWHEQLQQKKAMVTVANGNIASLDFAFTDSDLRKP